MTTVAEIKAMATALDGASKASQAIRVAVSATTLSKAARTPGSGISVTPAGSFFCGLHPLILSSK